MPRNGSGTYTLPQAAFVSGTTINSSAMNSDLSDIASALTQSLSADGQTPLTGALKFNSGTAAAPGITFASDSTTGIYLPSASNLGLAAGGTSIVTSSASATTWNLNTTFSGTLTSTGTLAATNNATVGGTLAVTGNSTFTGTINDPRGQYTGVLLNTLTASSSGTLSDTSSLTSNYSWYLLVFENLVPATNAQVGQLQVHSGGSFKSSSYLAAGGVTSATTYIPLSNNASGDVSNNASYGIGGYLKVFNPSGTTQRKLFVGQSIYFTTGAVNSAVTISGWWDGGNGAVDGFQAQFGSGNISTGTIKIYGFV
ncbi:MAG TPA: hypothetical protein VGT08_01715 [Terracidiphilus sp.]|nr:hypothetical protein [Terracidiphilus sp.]